jgi:hypothetical protein
MRTGARIPVILMILALCALPTFDGEAWAQAPERLTLSAIAIGRTSLGADTVLMLLSVTDDHGVGVSDLKANGVHLFAYPCPADAACVLVPLTVTSISEYSTLPGVYQVRAAVDQGRKDLVHLQNGPAEPLLLRVVETRPVPGGAGGGSPPAVVAAQGQITIPQQGTPSLGSPYPQRGSASLDSQ